MIRPFFNFFFFCRDNCECLFTRRTCIIWLSMIATRGRKGNEIDMVRSADSTVSLVFIIKRPEMPSFSYTCTLLFTHIFVVSFRLVSLLHYNTYYQRGINALRSKNSEKWRTQFHSFNWTPALRSLQSLWVRGNLTLASSAKLSPLPLRFSTHSLSHFFFFFIFNVIMVKKTNLCHRHRLSKVSSKKFSWKNFSVEIGFRPFVNLLLPMMMDFILMKNIRF